MEKKNKAVVTVVGNDTIGIIARVSAALAQHEANILDISQTVLSGMFNMMMIVDVSLSDFDALSAIFPRWAGSWDSKSAFSAAKFLMRCHRIDGGAK